MSNHSLSAPARIVAILAAVWLAGCADVWNDPYPVRDRHANVMYTAFLDRPKHLDPVQSYSEDEATFTAQIYEPPLQYHYLKRPYELIPATVRAVPRPQYFDVDGKALPQHAPAEKVAYSLYELSVKPGIRYQPHPAFARVAGGAYRYVPIGERELATYRTLADFRETDTRELTAEDYVYQIKRLAHPRLHSPVFGLMSEYIIGLGELGKRLKVHADTVPAQARGSWIDLRDFPLEGAEVVDRYTYRIKVKGKYPQLIYWLTMPFFAPMPWEADRFYDQPGMSRNNLSLDWYPVGTGPFMLVENNPNARMALARNPNFRGERYPCEGEAEDQAKGLLADCGKPLPFLDKVVFTREKEQIPYWNKFRQGYYDLSGISSDSFDQAVQMTGRGDTVLTDEMSAQGIGLLTAVATSDMYMGFNWLDPVVGGTQQDPAARERARKLRQAISIAIDQEEFISIFLNGRGIAAQGPIPPGIFGYRQGREGVNTVVYQSSDRPDDARRRGVGEAKRLLAEAGYPGGRDATSGVPLVINLDTTATGVGAKSRVDWLSKQFAKLDIQLVVRSTDYNRFQDKVRKGNVQLFYFGWNADYPDPENFLFLLYGPQGKVRFQGENAANYQNPDYDRLFEQMRNMDNGPERLALIGRMVEILRRDAPWVWGFHPKSYTLQHAWVFNRKPSNVGNNTLKYQRADPALRARMRSEWNRPVLWPLGVVAVALVALAVVAVRRFRAREWARMLAD